MRNNNNRIDQDIPLSNTQLSEICNELSTRANITDEDDLTTINNLFNNRGHSIVFTHNPGSDIGHWVVFIRKYDNTIYFFDSYGRSPKKFPKIYDFLKKVPKDYTIYYNPYEFQDKNSNYCGKYCLLVIAFNKLGLSYKQIEEILLNNKPTDLFVNSFFRQ